MKSGGHLGSREGGTASRKTDEGMQRETKRREVGEREERMYCDGWRVASDGGGVSRGLGGAGGAILGQQETHSKANALGFVEYPGQKKGKKRGRGL